MVLLSGTSSVCGIGRMTPKKERRITVTSPYGDRAKLVIPCGELVPIEDPDKLKKCTLNYNEYIVYSVDQIVMRYALRVKFIFQ